MQAYITEQVAKWDEGVDWDKVPEERAAKWVYDPTSFTWDSSAQILVKIHPESFAQGAMRACFRMKKWNPAYLMGRVPSHKDWSKASPYVAKKYLDPGIAADPTGKVYKDDVNIQLECAEWARKFNQPFRSWNVGAVTGMTGMQ